MTDSRRDFLTGACAAFASLGAGCVSRYGDPASYATQIIEPQHHNTVFEWVDGVLQQVRDQRLTSPRAAYCLSLPLTAGFLASNAITQEYDEPFGVGPGYVGADPEVAYGVAFATAAAEAFQQPFLFRRNEFLNRFPGSDAKSLGVECGRTVARHVLDMRTDDGSEPSEIDYYFDDYPRRDDALRWSPTGPFYGARPGPAFPTFDRGLYPGQGRIEPWTMTSTSQFVLADFHDPASPEFARTFDTIRLHGGADSTVRTDDESEIALFWEDGPWGITQPGHFIYIAMQLLQDRNLGFVELARAMALMGMTQCDASIAVWHNKYHHDVLRPETAIRARAPQFGNPDPRVRRERRWRSYIPTPEFPAYPSGHSSFGAAAAELIALIHGRDDIAFSGQSPDQVLWPMMRGVTRYWSSLTHMAEENGISRIYGGVHWDIDNTRSLDIGRAIARQAFETTFTKRG